MDSKDRRKIYNKIAVLKRNGQYEEAQLLKNTYSNKNFEMLINKIKNKPIEKLNKTNNELNSFFNNAADSADDVDGADSVYSVDAADSEELTKKDISEIIYSLMDDGNYEMALKLLISNRKLFKKDKFDYVKKYIEFEILKET